MSKAFKVVIAGGRQYNDYDFFKSKLNHLLQNKKKIHIIYGGASGADTMAKRYADEYGYPAELNKADWKKYGKAAGPKRNMYMASKADAVIVFWNGKSKGTKSMIKCANHFNLPLRIIKYD